MFNCCKFQHNAIDTRPTCSRRCYRSFNWSETPILRKQTI